MDYSGDSDPIDPTFDSILGLPLVTDDFPDIFKLSYDPFEKFELEHFDHPEHLTDIKPADTLEEEKIDYKKFLMFDHEIFLGHTPTPVVLHDCMFSDSSPSTLNKPRCSTSVEKKVITAGQSVLISNNNQTAAAAAAAAATRRRATAAAQAADPPTQKDSLCSKREGFRPETPESCTSTDDIWDTQGLCFRHSIDIEKFAECITTDAATKTATPLSCEATDERTRYLRSSPQWGEENQCLVSSRETNIRNTLNDHSYHQSYPSARSVDYLGVQTPTDSEEEIDVVSFEKSNRTAAAALPHHPSPVDQQQLQHTVSTALQTLPTGRRPRGRPPNSTRKRAAAEVEEATVICPPTKRTRQKSTPVEITPAATYQRTKATRGAKPKKQQAGKKTRNASRMKKSTRVTWWSEDEIDMDKRSLHNNMERQRRIEIRQWFSDLRTSIPSLINVPKASKSKILNSATAYCSFLDQYELSCLYQKAELQKEQRKLRAKLRLLRDQCFLMHYGTH